MESPIHQDATLRVDITKAPGISLRPIVECPDRGSVLPVSQQPECGCAELTACSAGKGKTPGAVTLAECIACKTPG